MYISYFRYFQLFSTSNLFNRTNFPGRNIFGKRRGKRRSVLSFEMIKLLFFFFLWRADRKLCRARVYKSHVSRGTAPSFWVSNKSPGHSLWSELQLRRLNILKLLWTFGARNNTYGSIAREWSTRVVSFLPKRSLGRPEYRSFTTAR